MDTPPAYPWTPERLEQAITRLNQIIAREYVTLRTRRIYRHSWKERRRIYGLINWFHLVRDGARQELSRMQTGC